jgi:tetratricopeptide (TPR) repeat protein
LALGVLLALTLTTVGCESGPSTRALGIYGDRAMEAGNYAEAAEYYEKYVERRPIDAEGHYKLATAYLGAERPILAREQFLLGMELRDDGRFIEGAADALVEMNQQEELFKLLRSKAEKTRSIEDYTRLGRFAARVGDVDEAEQSLLFAAKLDAGQNVEPQLELARFYESLGDDSRRLERLRMVLFLDPENTEAIQGITELGEVPGPAYAIPPAEQG